MQPSSISKQNSSFGSSFTAPPSSASIPAFKIPPSQAFVKGLNILMSCQTSRFNSETDIKKIELIENPGSGELTGIKLTCTEDPGWLGRGLQIDGVISNKIKRGETGDEIFTVEFMPKQIEHLAYPSLANKFRTFDGLEIAHLDAMTKFNQIIDGLMVTARYEKRFTSHDTKDGKLNSIVVKFTLFPDSGKAMLKTMDDFNNILIPHLAEKVLGVENFNRLVSYYGVAKDNVTPCIELRADALAQGIDAPNLR